MPFFIDKSNQAAVAATGAAQGFVQTQQQLAEREAALQQQEFDNDIALTKARSVAEYNRGRLRLLQEGQEDDRVQFTQALLARPEMSKAYRHMVETAGQQGADTWLQLFQSGDEKDAMAGFKLAMDAGVEADQAAEERQLTNLRELEESGVLPPVVGKDGQEILWSEAQMRAGATLAEMTKEAQKIVSENRKLSAERKASKLALDSMNRDLGDPALMGALPPESAAEARVALSEFEDILEENPSNQDALSEARQRFRDAVDPTRRELREENEALRMENERLRVERLEPPPADPHRRAVPLPPDAVGSEAAPAFAPPAMDTLGKKETLMSTALDGNIPNQLARGANALVNGLAGPEAPVDVPLRSIAEAEARTEKVSIYKAAQRLLKKHKDPQALADALAAEGIRLDEALVEALENGLEDDPRAKALIESGVNAGGRSSKQTYDNDIRRRGNL